MEAAKELERARRDSGAQASYQAQWQVVLRLA
jgi:hypothetical protein